MFWNGTAEDLIHLFVKCDPPQVSITYLYDIIDSLVRFEPVDTLIESPFKILMLFGLANCSNNVNYCFVNSVCSSARLAILIIKGSILKLCYETAFYSLWSAHAFQFLGHTVRRFNGMLGHEIFKIPFLLLLSWPWLQHAV